MTRNIDYGKYEKHYSNEGFFKKLLKYAKKAGLKAVYMGLLLYYVLQKPNIPKHIKGIIIGGLGYFILPIDLIPDLLPGIGYTDDIAILAGALVYVSFYIDDEVRRLAKSKIKDYFGRVDDMELEDIEESVYKDGENVNENENQ
ncbi:MAG: DUF1232 domain-containing protein [Tissierellia bacterium]|nr:DUF1232 domain-containing protein [Tissierellia bacterium]